MPDPPPKRDAENESRIQAFLYSWEREMGHDGDPSSDTSSPLDFSAQCVSNLIPPLRKRTILLVVLEKILVFQMPMLLSLLLMIPAIVFCELIVFLNCAGRKYHLQN